MARSKSAPDPTEELREKVGLDRGHHVRRALIALAVLALLGGVAFGILKWRQRAERERAPHFDTAAVVKGDLVATVTATGTLAGLDTVEVGAQVTGTIKTIHVDFNDRVTEGELLCEIDPAPLKAARDQARARLISAQGAYKSAKAAAKQARLVADRQTALAEQGLVSDQDLQSAIASAEQADAQVQSSTGEVESARASLEQAQTNLDKAWIRSPIDGIVLSRDVEVGQTVTASLQTPVLFTLAKDLRRMQLTINIDEADIGRVAEGEHATFTVDTYPSRTFSATLESLRNVAKTIDNVVTYEAILDVDNDDLALRPGMTATATLVTVRRKDVLLVPNAALRFEPPSAVSGRGPGLPLFGPRRGAPPAASSRGKAGAHVYVLKNSQPERVDIETGPTDGQMTEVLRGLDEGTEVIVDVTEASG